MLFYKSFVFNSRGKNQTNQIYTLVLILIFPEFFAQGCICI